MTSEPSDVNRRDCSLEGSAVSQSASKSDTITVRTASGTGGERKDGGSSHSHPHTHTQTVIVFVVQQVILYAVTVTAELVVSDVSHAGSNISR